MLLKAFAGVRRSLALPLLVVVLAAVSSPAQQSSAPADCGLPSRNDCTTTQPATSQIRSSLPPAPVHRFWDRTNILLFSGVAVVRGMDYASTRNFQARGRQEILLSDEVVNNSAGFAALEAAGTMTSVGISYILHRTGHHTLERWMSIGHIGVTAFGDVRNYSLESKHPPPK
jgi:hypothetical protein